MDHFFAEQKASGSQTDDVSADHGDNDQDVRQIPVPEVTLAEDRPSGRVLVRTRDGNLELTDCIGQVTCSIVDIPGTVARVHVDAAFYEEGAGDTMSDAEADHLVDTFLSGARDVAEENGLVPPLITVSESGKAIRQALLRRDDLTHCAGYLADARSRSAAAIWATLPTNRPRVQHFALLLQEELGFDAELAARAQEYFGISRVPRGLVKQASRVFGRSVVRSLGITSDTSPTRFAELIFSIAPDSDPELRKGRSRHQPDWNFSNLSVEQLDRLYVKTPHRAAPDTHR